MRPATRLSLKPSSSGERLGQIRIGLAARHSGCGVGRHLLLHALSFLCKGLALRAASAPTEKRQHGTKQTTRAARSFVRSGRESDGSGTFAWIRVLLGVLCLSAGCPAIQAAEPAQSSARTAVADAP